MGYQTYLTDPKGAYAAQFNSYGGKCRYTRTGRPLSGDSFIDGAECLTGRTLRPAKLGPKCASNRAG
jgi:hypothetical protein